MPTKTIGTYRVIALDAATRITGYSVYDNNTLVSYGTFRANDADTTERINEIKHWLETIIDSWEPDMVGLENIQLQGGNVEVYRTLANLQGVLLDLLFEKDIWCDLAYSSEWRKYCGVGDGKGRENKKRQAQDKVEQWYGQKCTQDEADAICLGKYFCSKTKNHNSWGEDI